MSYASDSFNGMLADSAAHGRAMGALADKKAATDKLNADLAYVLSVRAAIQEALSKVLPNAQLLVDQDLRDRIGRAGEIAWTNSREANASREAGRTFKLPPEAELSNFLVSKELFDAAVVKHNELAAMYNALALRFKAANELVVERTNIANERTAELNKRMDEDPVKEALLKSKDDALAQKDVLITKLNAQVAKLGGDLSGMSYQSHALTALEAMNEKLRLEVSEKNDRIEFAEDLFNKLAKRLPMLVEVGMDTFAKKLEDDEQLIMQLQQQAEIGQEEIQALKAQIAALRK